jgi:leucyl aminopeptidase (aminopeptidase T)
LNAALVDFDSVGRSAKAIAGKFRDGTSVSISGRGTDLTLELHGDLDIQDGRTDASDVASGENVSYVPPGFVFKEIEGGSAKGRVRLAPTLTRFGLLRNADLVVRDGHIVEWSSEASPKVLASLAEAIPERSRVLRAVTVGLNPMMRYGFGQDRFPAGAVGLVSTFTGILRGVTLKAGSEAVVRAGTL